MIAMRYGTVPVVRKTGGLADTVMPYDKKRRTGSGFVFENYHADELIRAVHEAVLLYKTNRDQWDGLVLMDMAGSYGWEGSAKDYTDLYENLKIR
ncbi:Glycogen synthase [bioreactor metagenome]|uniref:Glycogen synthase n=1 Tax=bioreactor metagenome TaxID=1076179 RepID=A0A645DB54_9ZZZZ